MAGFYKTEVKPIDVARLQGLTQQAAKSPLSALSEGMGKLDAFLDEEVKRDYTTDVMTQFKEGGLEALQGVDPTRLTQEGLQGLQFQAGVQKQLEAQEMAEQKFGLEELKQQEVERHHRATELAALGGDVKRRDALRQMTTAFQRANPNATQEQIQEFNRTALTKLTAGAGEVAKNMALTEQAQDFKTSERYRTNFLNTPQEATRADIGSMQSVENRNFANKDTTQKALIKDTIKSMKDNHIVISNINKAFDIDTTSKIKTGTIDSTKTWLEKKIGIESAQSFNNVDFNTRAGRILLSYLKSTSGTAVSDVERSFVEDVMLGGNLTDETYVLRALSTFRDSVKDENDTLGGQIFNSSPASATRFRQYPEVEGQGKAIETKKADTPSVDLSKFGF